MGGRRFDAKMLPGLFAMGFVAVVVAATGAPVEVRAGQTTSRLLRLAESELGLYLGKLFRESVAMAKPDGPADFVIGTTESCSEIRRLCDGGALRLPDGANADQGYTIRNVGRTTYVAGGSDAGVLHGVYGLLEQYGVFFQINGERIPSRRAYRQKPIDICVAPVFRCRGLLPWDNFLCGMSGFNPEDYELLIRRAVRMRLNMLQFHFYPGLALFTETVNGKPINPSFMGSPVDVFDTKGAAGERCFKGEKVFGCGPYVRNRGNPGAQAEACQKMMRDVIDYAHSRGMKTCVGFELMTPPAGDYTWTDKPGGYNLVNPLDERNAELSVERFHNLADTYPDSDYYWLWQTEARGFLSRDIGREPGAAGMRQRLAHWAGNPDLAGDIDYACLLKAVLGRLSPAERARVATGGWSVEHLFPGIHADFPPETIFASLNGYHPPSAQGGVDNYRVGRSGRPAWMIEWWEFDGVQWFPQFRAGWQEPMYNKCVENKVESVTLLGWKLSAVEHNVRYLADFAWNPGLKAADFYRSYVSRAYGKNSEALADLYLKYDAIETSCPAATVADHRHMLLGAGWQAMAIPDFPATSESLHEQRWADCVKSTRGLLAEQESLLAADKHWASVIAETMPNLDAKGRKAARLLRNRLQFRALYLESMICLNQSIVNFGPTGAPGGIAKARSAAAKEVGQAAKLARAAIEKYAAETRDRGDQGVVAQLNEQYLKTLESVADGLADRQSPYVSVDWTALRVTPHVRLDTASGVPWAKRDGVTTVTPATVGQPFLKVECGGDGTPFHSVWVSTGTIDLKAWPLLDLQVRAPKGLPLAILFQIEGDSATWHALNLAGRQSRFPAADTMPTVVLGDGKWHRLTWNLGKVVGEKLKRPDARLGNVILGTWETTPVPVVAEFREVVFGRRNMLD